GMYDEAMEQFANAIKIDPEHGGAYLDMGLVAMAQQKYSDAEGYFEKVIELSEGGQFQDVSDRREAALYNLGVIANSESRWEDAVGFLKGALRIRKDASDTYFHLALAYRGLDEGDKAIESMLVALAFDPNYAEARYELGRLYMDVSNEPSAAVEFRRAVDIAPNADPVIEVLASLGPVDDRVADARKAFKDGNAVSALGFATIAVAVEPTNVDALMVYGQAREDTGDLSGAIIVYRSVLDADPKNTTAAKALDRLNAKP
ncbi:MAG: tetratricopeptide repeat protein, partial [Coriobacteriia bacterium]|nr:tetratricopeptide repeat protein [Coriobacteriia bacterium]